MDMVGSIEIVLQSAETLNTIGDIAEPSFNLAAH